MAPQGYFLVLGNVSFHEICTLHLFQFLFSKYFHAEYQIVFWWQVKVEACKLFDNIRKDFGISILESIDV
jgi:hypothetical protein